MKRFFGEFKLRNRQEDVQQRKTLWCCKTKGSFNNSPLAIPRRPPPPPAPPPGLTGFLFHLKNPPPGRMHCNFWPKTRRDEKKAISFLTWPPVLLVMAAPTLNHVLETEVRPNAPASINDELDSSDLLATVVWLYKLAKPLNCDDEPTKTSWSM